MKSHLDVTEILTEDHRTVSRLFEEIFEQETAEGRENLFDEIFDELESHSLAEEEILYSRCEKIPELKKLLEQSFDEHNQVRKALEHLQAMDVTDSDFIALLKELQKNVDHHVQEEEGRLFPTIRRAWSVEELKELGQEVEMAKQHFLKAG